MNYFKWWISCAVILPLAVVAQVAGTDAELPIAAAKAIEAAKPWSSSTATRGKICLNGLWRFYPVFDKAGDIPAAGTGWGWFKVPGIWPPSNRAQEIILSNNTKQILKERGQGIGTLRSAWYKREIEIPADWAGRGIQLELLDVETLATVYLRGRKVGEIGWPGGTLDLTAGVEAGKKEELVIFVSTDLSAENPFIPSKFLENPGSINNRGLCGDAFLSSFPKEKRIENVRILTSVRNKRIDVETTLAVIPREGFKLRADITSKGNRVKSFTSPLIQPRDVVSGSVKFGDKWMDAQLWDVNEPNLYEISVSLLDVEGKVLDQTISERFGFREFWIDGKTFYLNGHPLHVRSLYVRSNEGPADMASLRTSQVICRRLKQYGFNTLITHNYSYRPGQIGYPDALYEATDREGIIATLSLPNGVDYKWNFADASVKERYERLTKWLIRRYQNRPSILFYAANHNVLAPIGSNAPHRVDGTYVTEESKMRSDLNARRKFAVEFMAPLIRSLDPTRGLYHHSAGDFGDIVTINHYPNWASPQERSDWFWKWDRNGVKPLYVVEYGLPHIASFSSYRGPDFIYNVKARQQVWDSEYAAAFLDQEAYRMTAPKIQSLKDELSYAERGEGVDWDTLNRSLSRSTSTFQATQAYFAKQNLPAFRGYGLSGFLPWDQQWFWLPDKLPARTEWPQRWENLGQPGIVPDWKGAGWEYIYEEADDAFRETPIAAALRRYNAPKLGVIMGDPKDFTEQSHNFYPGETAAKQLLISNDTARPVECSYRWEVSQLKLSGQGRVSVEAGMQKRVPVIITIPAGQEPGSITLKAEFQFGAEASQQDEFVLDVIASPKEISAPKGKIILFDPVGETDRLLKRLKIACERITTQTELEAIGKSSEKIALLIVGKGALAPVVDSTNATGKEPIGHFRADSFFDRGTNILFMEQSSQALEKIFGFRIAEVGHREAFPRIKTHPVWKNLSPAHLKNWRGMADPNRAPFDMNQVEPRTEWCGMENTRSWRVHTSGAVVSTLIEKPQSGEFFPLADAGFDLQYSPLLEWQGSQARALFFQFEVSDRSLPDPAADTLFRNAIGYLTQSFTKRNSVPVLYAGSEKGSRLLRSLHMPFEEYQAGKLASGQLLVAGPEAVLDPSIMAAAENGATFLGLGLSARELETLAPGRFAAAVKPVIPTLIEKWDDPILQGISNAELHWHAIPMLDTLSLEGNSGNEVLGIFSIGKGHIVLMQAAPWLFSDPNKPHLRSSYRRTLYLVSRLLGNLGAETESALPGLLARGYRPEEKPWLKSYYRDIPIWDDDPYRYYGW